MIQKTFLGVLLSVMVCFGVYGQSQDTTVLQGDVVSGQEDAGMVPESAGEKRGRLTIAIKNISKTDEGEQRHNRLLWNDGHWAGIGIHYSGLITNLTHMNLPEGAEFLSQSAKSIGVTLNPIDYTLLKSRHVGLVTGLGTATSAEGRCASCKVYTGSVGAQKKKKADSFFGLGGLFQKLFGLFQKLFE